MIKMTTRAKEEFDSYFDGKTPGTIRIYFAAGG